MVIAINIADYLEDDFYRRTILHSFSHIASENTTDKFIIISKTPTAPLIALANITYVYIKHAYKPTAINWLSYQLKISRSLKNAKADLLLTPFVISSRFSKLPQALLLPSAEHISSPSFYSKPFLSFYKKHLSSFISRAGLLITSSGFSKKAIEEYYNIESTLILPRNKVDVTAKDNQKALERYTDGHSYFFCIHSSTEIDGVTNVLRSFSLFKKRLKSSMRLLISVNSLSCEIALGEMLKTYKYRSDVHLVSNISVEEQVQIMGSSYAIIISSIFTDFEDVTANACIIALDVPSLLYLFNDTALYFQSNEPSDLSDKMMLLYKDESLATQLAANGNHTVQPITSFQQFWQQLKHKS